jgi:hypothetical protein
MGWQAIHGGLRTPREPSDYCTLNELATIRYSMQKRIELAEQSSMRKSEKKSNLYFAQMKI